MNEFPILLYTTPEGGVKVNAVLKDETLWLTQGAMAELFGVQSQAITKHLKNIYADGELRQAATCSKMEQVQNEGKRSISRELLFYNLDAIIAVGYRVNSRRATQFRIGATQVLKEYIIKGFALNDERMKQGGTPFGKDYFREGCGFFLLNPRAVFTQATSSHARRDRLDLSSPRVFGLRIGFQMANQ